LHNWQKLLALSTFVFFEILFLPKYLRNCRVDAHFYTLLTEFDRILSASQFKLSSESINKPLNEPKVSMDFFAGAKTSLNKIQT
tara:strand:- start:2464 stop:2715 length:252 start_codon:yes stop_codon:yes gene_type:complete